MNSRYGAFARQTNVQQRSATANNATSNVKADNNNIRSNFNDNSNEIGHHDNSFASHITNVTSHRTSSSTATSKLMDYLSSATYFYGAPSSSAPDDNYNNRNNKSNMIHDGDANHDNESYIDPISLLPASLRDLTVSPPAHTLSTHTHTHQDTNSHAYALPPSLSPTFASTQNQNNSQHLFANSVSSRANVIQLPPSYSSVVKISNKEDATNNNNTPNTQRSTNVQPPPTTNSSASGKQTPHTQPSHIRTKVCPFFLKGNCRYGQYCRYKHNFGKVCPNCGKDCALDDDSQRRVRTRLVIYLGFVLCVLLVLSRLCFFWAFFCFVFAIYVCVVALRCTCVSSFGAFENINQVHSVMIDFHRYLCVQYLVKT